MRIKDIPFENRPRERLKENGVKVLSDAELLAVILQKGTSHENVIDMSNRLLSKYNDLSLCNLNELMSIPGVGEAKAMQIMALFEFSKRIGSKDIRSKSMKCAEDVYQYAQTKIIDPNKEQFILLVLDSKNQVTKSEIISIGTLNSALIHPREIFKVAIRENANSVILVHNHPSGDPTPSNEDKLITMKLKEAGELLGIEILDHIIVGNGNWHSFK
jgi:DNA repair protein RadC